MADILLRGFEMPTDASLWLCIRTDGTVYNIKPVGTAHAVGTAVPLPEGHGRLIDGDGMVEGLMKCAKNPPDDDQESRWFYLFAAEIAKSCQTIVPADVTDINVGSKTEGETNNGF